MKHRDSSLATTQPLLHIAIYSFAGIGLLLYGRTGKRLLIQVELPGRSIALVVCGCIPPFSATASSLSDLELLSSTVKDTMQIFSVRLSYFGQHIFKYPNANNHQMLILSALCDSAMNETKCTTIPYESFDDIFSTLSNN